MKNFLAITILMLAAVGVEAAITARTLMVKTNSALADSDTNFFSANLGAALAAGLGGGGSNSVQIGHVDNTITVVSNIPGTLYTLQVTPGATLNATATNANTSTLASTAQNSTNWNGLGTNQLLGVVSPNSNSLAFFDINTNLASAPNITFSNQNGTLNILGPDGTTPAVLLRTNGTAQLSTLNAKTQITAAGIVVTNNVNDLSGVMSIYPVGRQLGDNNTYLSLDWGNRTVNDVNGFTAVNWNNRILWGGTLGNSAALNWSTAGILAVPYGTIINGNGGGVTNINPSALPFASATGIGIIDTNLYANDATIPNYNSFQPPLMGLESWVLCQGDSRNNAFWNEKAMLGEMTNMITYGYQAAGYNAILLDEGWSTNRDGSGNLASSQAFPHGIPWFISNLHSNGFKAGLFFTLGNVGVTTGDGTVVPGSASNLIQDATNAANWGVDFVYLVQDDNSPGYNKQANGYVPNYQRYKTFVSALQSTGRKILVYGTTHDWEPWLQQGMDACLYAGIPNYNDYDQKWSTTINVANGLIAQQNYCGPGKYLMSGWISYGYDGSGTNNSVDATFGYVATCALWQSPLFLARPYGEISGTTFNTVTTFQAVASIQLNPTLLTVDQDPLGLPPQLVSSNNFVETFFKKTAAGYVIAFLNTDTNYTAHTVSATWTNPATFPSYYQMPSNTYTMQDAQAGTNGINTGNTITYSLRSNQMAFLYFTPYVAGGGLTLGTVSNSMASGSNFLAGTSIAAGIVNPNPASPFAYTAAFNSGANGYLYYTQPGTLGLSGSGGLFVCLDSTGSIYEPIQFYGNGYNFLNGAVTITPKATAFTNAFQIVPTNAATVGIGVHSDNNGTNWVVPGVLVVSNSIVGQGFTSSVNTQVTNDTIQPSTITLSQVAGPMVSTNGSIFDVTFNGNLLTNIPPSALTIAPWTNNPTATTSALTNTGTLGLSGAAFIGGPLNASGITNTGVLMQTGTTTNSGAFYYGSGLSTANIVSILGIDNTGKVATNLLNSIAASVNHTGIVTNTAAMYPGAGMGASAAVTDVGLDATGRAVTNSVRNLGLNYVRDIDVSTGPVTLAAGNNFFTLNSAGRTTISALMASSPQMCPAGALLTNLTILAYSPQNIGTTNVAVYGWTNGVVMGSAFCTLVGGAATSAGTNTSTTTWSLSGLTNTFSLCLSNPQTGTLGTNCYSIGLRFQLK